MKRLRREIQSGKIWMKSLCVCVVYSRTCWDEERWNIMMKGKWKRYIMKDKGNEIGGREMRYLKKILRDDWKNK